MKYKVRVTVVYWMGEPFEVIMENDSLDDMLRECQSRWGRLSGFQFEIPPAEKP